MKYTIDAENKKIGRVATQAAVYLMGKNLPVFKRNSIPEVTVEIKNTSKASIDEKKKETKKYSRYSGYPGGRRVETITHLGKRLGYGEAVRRTIKGMLPKNKLQTLMMKNLNVTE